MSKMMWDFEQWGRPLGSSLAWDYKAWGITSDKAQYSQVLLGISQRF